MKKTFLFILTVLISITAFGQAFEGKIMYSNTYRSKHPQMADKQWKDAMGGTQEYLIKGGDYKSITNGTHMLWQLYINKDNKLYTKMADNPAAYWNDAAIQGDEVLKVEINKNVTKILGYKCDEVVLTCKSGKEYYYYNTELGVDAKLFENHKFGNWYAFVSVSNSLPLKSIIETPDFIMESIATEVIPMKLESNLFTLPTGMKTMKSPF